MFEVLTGSSEQVQEAERVREKGFNILYKYFTDLNSDLNCQAVIDWAKQISSAEWWLSIEGLFNERCSESCIAWTFATKLWLCYESQEAC